MSVDPAWKGMYKIGGVSAILIGILFVTALPFFFAISSAFPPSSGLEAMKAITQNKLFFLISESVGTLFTILFLPLTFALYLALKGVNRNYMLIASGLIGVGIPLTLLDTAVALSLVSLSDGYVAATGTQQAAYIAAADLAQGMRTALFILFAIPFAVGILITGLVMLKGVFSKWIAYVGVLAGILGLEPFPIPALGTLGVIILAGGGILLVIWLFVVGYKLYKLG